MKKKAVILFVVAITLAVCFYALWQRGTFVTEIAPSNIAEDATSVEVPGNIQSNSNCEQKSSIEYSYYVDTKPLWEKNNKFGLYIYAEEEDMFEIAQKLVNSNGGEWGYVLIPFNVRDSDSSKWSRVFTQLNNKKLIPIIQLWDVNVNDYKKQTKKAADFLNSFVWPIKYKYISVYNEVNDSKFWGGSVNPEEYAKILDYTIDTFKDENEDFFIMNGAFNITAPTDELHMDAFEYMKRMNDKVPGIFNELDGWASHPYPQPNFSGNVDTGGRWGIRAYEAELAYLKNELNLDKDLPVFITETGWAHAEGAVYNLSYPSVKEVSENFKRAYRDYWLKDERVRAVTPFTIRYNPPFDHFSWVSEDNIPYLHYEEVRSIKKVKGEPPYLKSEVFDADACP